MEPLSEDARAILALIRQYPEIEGKRIASELGIDMERVTKGAKELHQRNLIGMAYVFSKEYRYELSYEPSRFYPKY